MNFQPNNTLQIDMTRILKQQRWLTILLWFAGSAVAQTEATDPHWLATRATESDVVVVAQLERTDYEYRRNFPVDGRTWFNVLFDYKTPREAERLIVLETGLKPVLGCYFPDIPPQQEQPRYLLFLQYDDERALRGHAAGCAIELAVTTEGQYAALWPQFAFEQFAPGDPEQTPNPGQPEPTGLDPVLSERTQTMQFQGPSARIDGSQMVNHLRIARAEAEGLRIEGTDLVYTQGIALSDLRELMRPGLFNQPSDQRRRIEAIQDVLNNGSTQ
ncbi:MAG: hypothetical protein AAGH65_09775 [Pseudomonadota bacterium]